jgi:hypothetical protein
VLFQISVCSDNLNILLQVTKFEKQIAESQFCKIVFSLNVENLAKSMFNMNINFKLETF